MDERQKRKDGDSMNQARKEKKSLDRRIFSSKYRLSHRSCDITLRTDAATYVRTYARVTNGAVRRRTTDSWNPVLLRRKGGQGGSVQIAHRAMNCKVE